MDKVSSKIRLLIDYLNDATAAYDEGKPYISDIEWDNKYFELENLEKDTGIVFNDSPTQTIIYNNVTSLNKATHNHKMLSLDKTKSEAEVQDFLGVQPYVAMCKMDGLTCSLMYRGGVLVSAETRGNGLVGEDVLHNAKVIRSIPQRIPHEEELIIDGEIICTYDDFEQFKGEYKNPRNFAAGSIRLLDAKEAAGRNLTFVAWDVITSLYEGERELAVSEKLEQISTYGFTVVPYIVKISDRPIANYISDIKTKAENYGYPIDGVVFKFNDCAYGRAQGETGHHFKNAIAYKFADETYTTRLLDLEWSMGRTGVLTPVAVFEPVEIDGSVIERASLHNVFVVNEIFGPLGPFKGQEIEVFKANMIIPQIHSVNRNRDANSGPYIDCITTCPVCGRTLTRKFSENSIFMMCENAECDGKLVNKLDHFCGKKGLDIKGLSKATLEKLIEWEWVNESFNLFTLSEHRDEWVKKPGFGPKSVDKILDAIDIAAKTCTLQRFIVALGISLVGESASKDLVKTFPTWESFMAAVENPDYSFEELDGFGYEMNKSLKEHDYSEAIYSIKCGYVQLHEEEGAMPTVFDLEDKTFVITGKVHLFKNREELKAHIESRGGKVTSSVTKATSYLINNDISSDTAKNKTAKTLGIPIISEEKFISLFGDLT